MTSASAAVANWGGVQIPVLYLLMPVEAEVASHPAVAMAAAAAAAVPDDVFGERVCAAVTLRSAAAAGGPGQFGAALNLEELRAFLTGRGVSKEYFPEYLVVMDQFPLSIGGKAGQGGSRAGRDHGQER